MPKLVGRTQVTHWWRIIAAVVLVAVLAIVFWPSGNTERQVSLQRTVPSSTQNVNPTPQHIPSRQFGKWKIIAGPTHWTSQFCPPAGSYTDLERQDTSVGLTALIKRPNGQEVSVYHPSGEQHLDIGAFTCIRLKADRAETIIKIQISNSPIGR